MLTIEQVVAGPQRSVLITSEGVFAWGNLEVLRTLPEGVDAAEVCAPDATRIGHRSFSQPVPQRLSPLGTRWEGLVDAGHSLLAWADGQAYAVAPQVRDAAGAVPRPLALGRQDAGVRRIWAGEQQAYVQDREGALWGWSDAMPGAQRVQGLPSVRSVSVGMGHALALDARGQVWSWGANAAGQLGQGDLVQRSRAQRVVLPQGAAAVVAVAAGATHSLALDEKGRLWGWGSNHQGQLDQGLQAAYSPGPVRIAVPGRLSSLAAGLHFSAATTQGGQVLAWGWNGLGQLGQGDAAPRGGFRTVPGLAAVQQISVGGTHVLALEHGGRCWAWGDNRHGACQGEDGAQAQSRPHALALHALNDLTETNAFAGTAKEAL
ncbi:regulator of chromosome condensation RCC1 [Delftia sp. Cs1-4]|uniref:RCC1 domain-containing protein n=1 Tax=Delftia sp. (strain Cs1-4) TaxID=742013 RepID=UPI00020E8491|nr:chromosome condensation regulator [Delftia sp. Cs1-4]AEF90389.1 regulator of chromosome condensation RCC1 [Delftia sp. Cs1-4]